jgi:helix-turn-helix protein
VNRLAYGLRRTRLEYGLNMSQMATILGVHVATVSRIESGERLGYRRQSRPGSGYLSESYSGRARNATTPRRLVTSACGAGAPDNN